jgi:hypothetical protein
MKIALLSAVTAFYLYEIMPQFMAAALIFLILFTVVLRLLFLAGPKVMPMIIVGAVSIPVAATVVVSFIRFL